MPTCRRLVGFFRDPNNAYHILAADGDSDADGDGDGDGNDDDNVGEVELS